MVEAINQRAAWPSSRPTTASANACATSSPANRNLTTTPRSPWPASSSAMATTRCPRGILADVAPTVLDLLGLDQPEEMTGASMIDGTSSRWPDLLQMSCAGDPHQLRLLRCMSWRASARANMSFYRLDDEHVEALFAQALAHVEHE